MKTQVTLQARARTPREGDDFEVVCDIEGGNAAVLTPYFDKLNERSGQLLVFINGATFGGDDLKILAALLREIRADIQSYSPTWKVSLGWQLEPPHASRELFASVDKTELNGLLDKVWEAIEQANRQGAWVRFNFWGES